MTSVSVALCTYNGARYIEAQLRSILDQTVLPDEIVISDDGSSDDTLAIVDRVLGAAEPSLSTRVIANPSPLGVVANFEQAMLACSGDVIVLCDQDDVWHADRVAVALDRLEQSPSLLLVHSDARLVDGAGVPLGHSLFDALGVSARERAEAAAGDELAVLLRRNLVTGATTMLRREVLDSAVPFPEGWVHDEWLAMIAASIGDSELLDRELVDYRQHGSNQIGVRRLGKRAKVGRILEPRSGRNVYLAQRARVLAERLAALPAARPDAVRRAHEKLAHLEVRAGFSRHRIARIIPVLRELSTGRYAHYSRGYGDVLRDLLQPAGDEN